MKDNYVLWFIATIFTLHTTSCGDALQRREIIKEIREIKMELRK
jgi:hypothetical protein